MAKKSGKGKTVTKVKALDPDVEFTNLEDSMGVPDAECEQAEIALNEAKRNLERANRRRDYSRARQAKVLAAAAASMKAASEFPAYEPELYELLTKVGGLPHMIERGATDEAIHGQLATGWQSWAQPTRGESTGRGGSNPAVWINAKGYRDKPTLEGSKLISETRRILGIPLPAKTAPGPTAKTPPVKSKSAGKPAAKPSLVKAAAKRKTGTSGNVEKFVATFPAKAKTAAPAAKAEDARSFSRWLDGVRKVAQRAKASFDKNDPRLKTWHEENLSPPAVGKILKAEEAKWAAATAPPKSKIEGGKTYTAEELKLSPALLDAEISETYSILPRAPKFAIDNTGRVGGAIGVDNRNYAVIHALIKPGLVTYTLHPLFPTEDWNDPVQSPLQRWRGHENKPPEEIPLKGVKVEDEQGAEWILGDDDERIFVTAPRAAREAATPAAEKTSAVDTSFAGDELNVRTAYAAWMAEHDAPPLSDDRLETIMSLRPELRHLMLDPKLNDYGVWGVPESIHVHGIPAKVGDCSIELYQDLDGKWWSSNHYQFRIATLGGAGGPMPGPGSGGAEGTEGDRHPDKFTAVESEIDNLLKTLKGSGDSAAEKGAVRRFVDGLQQFRKDVRQKVKEFGGTVKHTPAKPRQPDGPRTIETHRKDTISAWYVHFKATYQALPGCRNANPGPAHPEVSELYDRYHDEDLTPADAAREFYKIHGVQFAPPSPAPTSKKKAAKTPAWMEDSLPDQPPEVPHTASA